MNKKVASIYEIADLNSKSITKSDTPNNIYYLDTSNITRNSIDNLQYIQLDNNGFPSRAKRKVKDKTIVYSTVRPNQEHFGILNNPTDNLIVSTGFTTVDVKDVSVIDPLYLYYYITQKFITNHLQAIAEISVSSYPSINPSDIGKLTIAFPVEIQKQQKNIALLSAIDQKIELNNCINAELEAMVKTLYDYWFVQFDFPNEEGKPYKSSGGKMVYNTTLKREIPATFTEGVLDNLGQIVGGSTPDTKNSDNFCIKGVPWITPNDLSNNQVNKYISKGEKNVSYKGIKSASLKKYPSGTVLLTSRAPVGYMAIARNEFTTNQGFKSFVPNKGYPTDFIYYTIKSYLTIITNFASGSTFKEISASVLKTVPIVLPPSHVVKDYINKIDSLTKQQNILEQECSELKNLKDWLLPMLMNGQVTVK